MDGKRVRDEILSELQPRILALPRRPGLAVVLVGADPATSWWLAKAAGQNHVWEVNLHSNGTSMIRAVDIDGVEFDKVDLATPRTKPVE